MQDYTLTGWGDVIRGSRWPVADDTFTVRITNSSGWPQDADQWTWEVLLSRATAGADADLTLTAAASLDGNTMILTFHATPLQTDSLPGTGRRRFYVDVRSTDGAETVSYYDCVQGFAWVRDPAGQG